MEMQHMPTEQDARRFFQEATDSRKEEALPAMYKVRSQVDILTGGRSIAGQVRVSRRLFLC